MDDELAWRKRELTTIKLMVSRSRAHEERMLLRAGVCLLYAHWEGFIKLASMAYIAFVARLGLQYRDLSGNLIAVSLKSRLRVAGQAKRSHLRVEIVEFLLSDLRTNAALSWEDAIDTESNLNSEAFKDITITLGIDYNKYVTKEPLIDGRLLASRHKIAHGERLEMSVGDYEVLHSEVIELIDYFRDDIQNAAALGKYRR